MSKAPHSSKKERVPEMKVVHPKKKFLKKDLKKKKQEKKKKKERKRA